MLFREYGEEEKPWRRIFQVDSPFKATHGPQFTRKKNVLKNVLKIVLKNVLKNVLSIVRNELIFSTKFWVVIHKVQKRCFETDKLSSWDMSPNQIPFQNIFQKFFQNICFPCELGPRNPTISELVRVPKNVQHKYAT